MTRYRTIAGGAALLALVFTGSAGAQGQPAAEEVNRIINELAPARGEVVRRPEYRRQVRRVTVPVRPSIAEETAYTQNSIIEERTYVLNYNHTEDFTIHFAFDSFALRPEALAVLDVVGAALSDPRLAGEVYLVGGHTDTAGPADYNQWLSEKRAWTATSYLVNTWGIEPYRLQPVGYGETLLADPGRGANRLNRRVEFTLIDTRPELAPVAAAPRPAPSGPVQTGGNVVCDTQPVALTDPRPPRHNLDDFGSPRTPVECEDVHVTPDAAASPAPATGSGDAIDQTNAAIGN